MNDLLAEAARMPDAAIVFAMGSLVGSLSGSRPPTSASLMDVSSRRWKMCAEIKGGFHHGRLRDFFVPEGLPFLPGWVDVGFDLGFVGGLALGWVACAGVSARVVAGQAVSRRRISGAASMQCGLATHLPQHREWTLQVEN